MVGREPVLSSNRRRRAKRSERSKNIAHQLSSQVGVLFWEMAFRCVGTTTHLINFRPTMELSNTVIVL